MWFQFPEGTDKISVELQNFVGEVEQNGRNFFRAPDHFAPTILSLPGYSAARPTGDDLPADLPPTIPGAAGAVDDLTGQISALKEEIEGLKKINTEITAERDRAVAKLTPLADENARLKAEVGKKAA